MDSLTYLSLYSGGGGLDLGFKLAVPGARAVGYLEIDAAAIALLVDHMQTGQLDDAPLWSDSGTFDGAEWRGKVDWIIGGFPCQPWSVAGRQAGLDDERWLWPHIRQILGDVQPRGAFFENVPGLFRGGLGPILGDLAALGFDAEWITVRASDVGASHRRERVFIMAYSSRDGEQGPHRQAGRGRGGRVRLSSKQLAEPSSTRRTAARERCDQHTGDEPETGFGDVGHPGHDARGAGNGEQQDEQQRGQGRRDTETAEARESGGMGDARGERLQGSDDHTGAPGGVQQEPGERRRELADADGDGQTTRIQRRGDDSQGRSEPNGSTEERGASVGNASSSRPQGHGRQRGLREDQEQTQARRGSSRMVDSTGSGRWAQGNGEYEPVGFDWGSRPLLWPPGPTSPEWQRIVEERPDLAPAKSEVRGVDDGLARGLARTDRLRILGNGCVPQQVALAFTILAERLAE